MAVIPLACPMCGALIDLDESQEFGLCSFCGTKVMREKIIVEHHGNISLNTAEETKNLYIIARRALEDEDYNNAANYYNQLLIRNPNDWEASFYLSYCEAYSCKIGEIALAASKLSRKLDSTFNLLKGSPDSAKQVEVVSKLYTDIKKLASTLHSGAFSMLGYIVGNYTSYIQAIQGLLFHFGDLIEGHFNGYPALTPIMLDSWKESIKMSYENPLLQQYESKIQRYEPSYVARPQNAVTEKSAAGNPNAYDGLFGCLGAFALIGVIVWIVVGLIT